MLCGKIVLRRTKRIAVVSVGLNDFQAFHKKLNTVLGMGTKGLMNDFGKLAAEDLAWNKVAGSIN
jgi:hypothetical protein